MIHYCVKDYCVKVNRIFNDQVDDVGCSAYKYDWYHYVVVIFSNIMMVIDVVKMEVKEVVNVMLIAEQ